jgi:hypothetical protein
MITKTFGRNGLPFNLPGAVWLVGNFVRRVGVT